MRLIAKILFKKEGMIELLSYYIIAVCVKRFFAFFHNATLDYRRKKYGFCDHRNSAVTVRLCSYGKLNTALTFSQKRSGGVISYITIKKTVAKDGGHVLGFFINLFIKISH